MDADVEVRGNVSAVFQLPTDFAAALDANKKGYSCAPRPLHTSGGKVEVLVFHSRDRSLVGHVSPRLKCAPRVSRRPVGRRRHERLQRGSWEGYVLYPKVILLYTWPLWNRSWRRRAGSAASICDPTNCGFRVW